MLSSKTVFIVGAGASKEVGLPIGSELKNIIATKLDMRFNDWKPIGRGDLTIFEVLQRKHLPYGTLQRYADACRCIRDGIVLSDSIDDFIDAHQHDRAIAACGKLAITRSILEAEKRSKLYYERKNVDDTVNFDAIKDTWYVGFYNLLNHKMKKENLEGFFNNVTVISFNYDRCIQHFLVHAIAANYQIQIDEARHIVEKLIIFYPYGSVGAYFGKSNEIVEFGSSVLADFDKVVSNIRTYTEQMEDHESLGAIRKAVVEAEVIMFLGTAYHPNNMGLLVGEKDDLTRKTFYATRKGISSADIPVVHQAVSKLCGKNASSTQYQLYFQDECHNLFEEYRMSMRR
jgi:hypothetical protein